MPTTEAPERVTSRPRLRWVVPFCLGLAAGGLLGTMIVAVVMPSGDRAAGGMPALRPEITGGLAAERLDIARVLNQVGAGPNVRVTNDSTDPVGWDGGAPGTQGTAVRRRIVIYGTLPEAADLTFANQLRKQLDAELARHEVHVGGGSTSSNRGAPGSNYFNYIYWLQYHKDGLTGRMDVELNAHGATVRIVVSLYEAR